MASLGSDSWIFVNSIGVHAGAHTPYVDLFACSDDWVFRNLFQSFFYQGTCISDVHTRAYTISILWNKMDDFS